MRFQHVFILCSLIMLNACGGGGGSGGKTEPVKVAQAPLVFTEAKIEFFIDEVPQPNSLSGGSGSGILSYNSSNANVVSINSTTGALTVVAAGEAVITASKAADSQYNPAAASYRVIVHLRQQQPLVFAQNELKLYARSGTSENMLSGGSGTGVITYSSSDAGVLKVNSLTGVLEPIAEGKARITAVKAADNIYAEASASFEVNVEEIIKGLEIGIGVSDTEIKWQGQPESVTILRSTDSNCNFLEINSCANSSNVSLTNQTSMTDSLINLYEPGYIVIESKGYRSQRITVKPNVADISKRYGTTYFVFGNKIWAMGGLVYEYDHAENFYNSTYFRDLWSSSDGISWHLEKENTGIDANYNFQVINFRGELYLLGGLIGQKMGGLGSMSIWKSKNARDWVLIQNNPAVSGACRKFYAFKDKLWCYASFVDPYYDGLWSSVDGVSWKKENSNLEFNRYDMTFYTINNKLFMTGGCNGDHRELKNDIWSTVDGVTWIKELENAAFPPLERTNVTEFNGKLILTGGVTTRGDENYANITHDKSLISDDGIHWRALGNDILGVGPHGHHEIINFKNKLYLYPDASAISPDGAPLGIIQGIIWKSDDGANWRVPVDVNFQWTEY